MRLLSRTSAARQYLTSVSHLSSILNLIVKERCVDREPHAIQARASGSRSIGGGVLQNPTPDFRRSMAHPHHSRSSTRGVRLSFSILSRGSKSVRYLLADS